VEKSTAGRPEGQPDFHAQQRRTSEKSGGSDEKDWKKPVTFYASNVKTFS
jgi:hypothetical protein